MPGIYPFFCDFSTRWHFLAEFQHAALMFAFKGSDAIIHFRSGGRGRLGGAHSRRQDPKTPVEQALMRGLVTA
jgi:hypothetical protein